MLVESTESITEKISDLQDTDPSLIQKYMSSLGESAFQFAIQVLIALVVYIIGTKLIRFLLKIFNRALDHREVDQGVQQFLDSLLKALLYIVLLIVILGVFGVTTTSVAAVLASAGVAIGLALQGSLSNLAGGVLILILKPFRVGDYIIEDSHGNEGTVVEISIFYTRLRTLDMKTVILPNGALANTSITNVTTQKTRKIVFTVGIAYEADLKKAKEILQDVAEAVDERVKEIPIQVYVSDLADSSVNLGLRFDVPTESYWDVKWKLTEQVKMSFDAAGIEIPYQKIDVTLKK